jgi:hypothetical protein
MKALSVIWHRLFRRPAPPLPSPGFSYRIHWTKTTWNWPPDKRERVLVQIQSLIAREDFDSTLFERRYRLEELGEGEYAGESLVSLGEVLKAYSAISQEGV